MRLDGVRFGRPAIHNDSNVPCTPHERTRTLYEPPRPAPLPPWLIRPFLVSSKILHDLGPPPAQKNGGKGDEDQDDESERRGEKGNGKAQPPPEHPTSGSFAVVERPARCPDDEAH